MYVAFSMIERPGVATRTGQRRCGVTACSPPLGTTGQMLQVRSRLRLARETTVCIMNASYPGITFPENRQLRSSFRLYLGSLPGAQSAENSRLKLIGDEVSSARVSFIHRVARFTSSPSFSKCVDPTNRSEGRAKREPRDAREKERERVVAPTKVARPRDTNSRPFNIRVT